MNISLTPELEKLIAEKLDSGLYISASEVVREGLRLLQRQEDLRQHQLEGVRAKINRGIEQLKRGEGIPGTDAVRRLRQSRQKK